MSTGQKYSGKGDSTTFFEQSAETYLPVPLTNKHYPDLLIHARIYQAQTRLLELADGFVATGFEDGPIQAINVLLTHWLITPSNRINQHQLGAATMLANLLTILHQAQEGQRHV